MKNLKEFQGERAYLSNMYPCNINFTKNTKYYNKYKIFHKEFDEEKYNSSERLYQALKSKNKNYKEYLRLLPTPKKTKTISRQILTTKIAEVNNEDKFLFKKNWNKIKLLRMELCLDLKFEQNQFLVEKLINEKNKIVEYNYWNDTFWGVCDGIGKNNLGKLLEKKKREFLRLKFEQTLEINYN